MRRAAYLKFGTGFFAIGVAFVMIGCEQSALTSGFFEAPAPVVDPVNDLTAQARAHAQRVSGISQAQETGPPRQVLWLDTTGERFKKDPADPQKVIPPTQPADPGVSVVKHPADPINTPTQQADRPSVTRSSSDQLTRAQVYVQLLKTVRASDDSNLSKALTAATLGAVGPHGEMDWSLLASLSPRDRDLVERYHKTVSSLRREILIGGGTIDQSTVADRLDDLFGKQPVTIRNIQLCQKVLGFGVYDAFPDHTFVAGREQKLIIYVELDHFLPVAREQGDGYEVKLKQEIELYESNGFEVWSHEPVMISDISLNKRRDFFIVQLVTLPAQLGLGKYHLKVRVYDENAGTRDESSVDIQLVADRSMVRGAHR